MNISEILRGTVPGTMQQVGYMTMIPLTREKQDDNICDPSKILLGTANYGEMSMENPTANVAILPFGSSIMTKQAAQNHATPKAKLLRSNSRDKIHYAACIQETQGGLIGQGSHEISILPWVLKEEALKSRDTTEYNKLWPSIREFNKVLGVRVTGHLELYLDHFKDDLDTFIAQFEIIPNQVGAIILMNGYVMGIELAPNYSYFKDIWRPLIRECYGSLVLQYTKEFGGNPPMPKTRTPLNTNVKDLKALQKELVRVQKDEDDKVKSTIRKFIGEDFELTQEEKNAGYCVQTVKNEQFIGQIVESTSGDIVYASLLTSTQGIKQQSSRKNEPFTI